MLPAQAKAGGHLKQDNNLVILIKPTSFSYLHDFRRSLLVCRERVEKDGPELQIITPDAILSNSAVAPAGGKHTLHRARDRVQEHLSDTGSCPLKVSALSTSYYIPLHPTLSLKCILVLIFCSIFFTFPKMF